MAEIYPPFDSPWLASAGPIKILTTLIKTVNDTMLLGETIDCLGPGQDALQGPSNCADTCGGSRTIYEIFSPLYFPDYYPCDYTPGKIGGDIAYGVNYFRGGQPPPDSCLNPYTGQWLYSAGDVNGDCRFIGSDITYLLGYFHGIHDHLRWCPQTPPLNRD